MGDPKFNANEVNKQECLRKMVKNKVTTTVKLILFITVISLATSCASKKDVIYFQDLRSGVTERTISPNSIKVQSGDKLSIVVNSKDPQLSNLFNLPVTSQIVGVRGSSSQQMSCYTIDQQGNIDFPIIGLIHVSGMSRTEIAQKIKQLIISNNFIKDPIVTVEFANLYVAVLGEVNRPGRYAVDRDNLTLIDAISMAGDLTIYGNRNKVTIIREKDNKQTTYMVDLRSANDLFSSPAYYLQQGDVVYIEPNTVRARQSTVNGNNVLSTSFWMSVASLATTIALFFIRR